MVSVSTALSALAIATIATGVDAHGTLQLPALKFTGTAYGGDFSALVPMSSLPLPSGVKGFEGMDATENAGKFAKAFKASNYKSFKEFIMKNQDMSKGRSKMPKTAECGFTDPTGGPVSALPDQLVWYGGKMNHPGPCEVWCDNEIVVPFTPNCQEAFPAGKIPYAKDKCVGKSRLTLYWMSTLMEWQVYIDCAKIGNGGGGAAASGGAAAGGAAAGGAAAGGNNAGRPNNNGGNAQNNNNGGNTAGRGNNNNNNAARGKTRSLDFDDLNDETVPVAEYNATAVNEEAEREATEELLPVAGPNGEVDTEEILPESGPEDN